MVMDMIFFFSDDLLEDQAPMKRHSDAIFTDNYSRFRKQMAVKKYLNSVLTGKRRYQTSASHLIYSPQTWAQRCYKFYKFTLRFYFFIIKSSSLM